MFNIFTLFWFYVVDTPLETFFKTSISSYQNLSIEEFKISLRFAFMCFLFNVLIRLRNNYRSFKKLFCVGTDLQEVEDDDTTNTASLIKIEEDVYKIDFIADKEPACIIVRKSTEYRNIEEIYTDDYDDCITNEVKPFFVFKQDKVCPRYTNKIFDRQDKSLIVTLRDAEERTVITDYGVVGLSTKSDDSDETETLLPSSV